MHRQLINTIHDMAGYALEAAAKGDHVTARRWLKEIQHDTSDQHIEALETFNNFATANGDLPRVETVFAMAKGVVIEGTYKRGPVL